MKNLWIVPIEPVETRYTKHWYTYLQPQIQANCPEFNVVQIEVDLPGANATPGAFLNFADTIGFKARQTEKISQMFSNGEVKEGDVFLITDYWNPMVHGIRYMSDLLDIPVKLAGICHAGAWDPADLLGQKFKNKHWAEYLELSYDELYDLKIFATEFSRVLYEDHLMYGYNNAVTGFPMEYYDDILTPYWDLENPPEKEDIVVFPHRKSPEKNLKLFYALAERMPDYKFVVAMDVCKTKDEYHDLLYRSKLAFSASLQETLGISMGIEALRCGCDVLVPDRLSYQEMAFAGTSKYSGSIANSYDAENNERDVLMLTGHIRGKMVSYNESLVKQQHDLNFAQFFDGRRKFYHKLSSLA